jgi:hypothetical protein
MESPELDGVSGQSHPGGKRLILFASDILMTHTSQFPYMGVLLLTCITPSEITKASAIYSSFPIEVSPIPTDSFDAKAASAECLITMTAPPDNSAHASFWTVRDELLETIRHLMLGNTCH